MTNVTRRRAALGLFAAATPAAVTARAPAHPDGELIRLCGAFNALQVEVLSAYYGPDSVADDHERDAIVGPIRDHQERLLCEITPLRATTVQGVKARAEMFIFYAEDFPRALEERGGWDDQMLLALVRDAAALSVRPDAAWPGRPGGEGL